MGFDIERRSFHSRDFNIGDARLFSAHSLWHDQDRGHEDREAPKDQSSIDR
jgi:hypothetical protein